MNITTTELGVPDMAVALATTPSGHAHERFDHKDELSIRSVLPTKEDVDGHGSGDPADITPFQKMLSATTGSLITGLTSKATHLPAHAGTTQLIAGSDTA